MEAVRTVSAGAGAIDRIVSQAGRRCEHNGTHQLSLSVQIQPASYLEQSGELITFGVTNSCVVALYKDGGKPPQYAVKFYDDSGHEINPPSIPFRLTLGDLAKIAQEEGKSHINLAGGHSSSLNIREKKDELNLDSDDLQTIENSWKGANLDTYVEAARYASSNTLLVQGGFLIIPDVPSETLAFQRGKRLAILKTADGAGRFLPPAQWEITTFQDIDKLAQEDIEKYPVLLRFRSGVNPVPIPGTDVGIDQERGVLNIYRVSDSEKIFSSASVGARRDPLDENRLVFLDPTSKRLNSIDLATIKAESRHLSVDGRDLSLDGEIKCFRIEPQGNFILILLNKDGKSEIQILNRDKLEVEARLPARGERFEIDSSGVITFQDEAGLLRQARTNVKTFEMGGVAAVRSAERLRLLALHAIVTGLTLPDSSGGRLEPNANQSVQELLGELQHRISKRFAADLGRAKTVEAVDNLEARVHRLLETSEEFRQHPEALDRLLGEIRDRKEALKTEELQGMVDALTELVAGAATLEQMLQLPDHFRALTELRRETLISDRSLRSAIDGQIKSLLELRDSKLAGLEVGINSELTTILERLTDDVASVLTEIELDKVGAGIDVEDFRKITSLLSDKEQRLEWRTKLRVLFKERRQEIQQGREIAALAEREELAESIIEIRSLHSQLRREVAEAVGTVNQFDRFLRDSPAAGRITLEIARLPDRFRAQEQSSYDRWVEESREDFRRRAAIEKHDSQGSGESVVFVKHALPKYRPKPVNWVPTVEAEEGAKEGLLVFRDNLGRSFIPKPTVTVPISLSSKATKEAIKQHWAEAENFFAEPERQVAPFNPRWVLNGYNLPVLDKMARLARFQLGHEYGGKQRGGIIILEGEAGSGKNINVDILAHFAGYELFEFACNRNTAPEDVTFAWEFHPKTGTIRINSALLDKVQRPGSIILLDEINALQPGVAKLFNAPFDHRRRFHLPDGRVVPIHPSVILLGTMNPQHYLGVEKLSPEVKSRARIIEVGYPPLKEGGRFTGYEVGILAGEREALAQLTPQELALAFDLLVNSQEGNGAEKFVNDTIKREILGLHEITQIADVVRRAHDRYRSGESPDPVEIVFSLRESIQIASELDDFPSVKATVSDVLLPKADTAEEKKVLRTIIEQV